MNAIALPPGVVVSSRGRRLGAALLECVLAIVTLGIGYVIWSFYTYGNGQTPGKKLMGMRVVTIHDGRSLSFGMTLLREWIVKGIIGSVTFGIAYLWILFDANNQSLYDKIMNTVVVDDPQGLTLPQTTTI
jgi:uncharacterized RDD family membrane protein YckC